MIVEYILGTIGVLLALSLFAYVIQVTWATRAQIKAFKRIVPACQRYIDVIPDRQPIIGICFEMKQLGLPLLTKRETKLLRPSRKNLKQFFDADMEDSHYWWPVNVGYRNSVRASYCKWVIKNYGNGKQ